MNLLEIFLIAILFCSILVRVIIERRLHNHVNKEKLMAVQDVTTLWKHSVPPKEILSVEGLRLYKVHVSTLLVSMGTIVLLLATSVFGDIFYPFLG